MRIHSPVLGYFDAVRRAGSIREAARQLNVASSAINRQILNLEDELGAPVFDRHPGGLRLTPVGEALARHVNFVFEDLSRTMTDIADLQGARTGHVTVAAVESAMPILRDTILAMRKLAPRVTTTVTTMGSFAIPDALARGEADIGVAFALRKSIDLRQVHRAQFRLGAVIRPDHPLAANRQEVTLSACMAYPLILATPDLSITNLLQLALQQEPHHLRPMVTSGSINLMQELAAEGYGIAFQTRVGLDRRLADNSLVYIPISADGPVLSDLGAYVRAGRKLPLPAHNFLQLLTEQIRRLEALDQGISS